MMRDRIVGVVIALGIGAFGILGCEEAVQLAQLQPTEVHVSEPSAHVWVLKDDIIPDVIYPQSLHVEIGHEFIPDLEACARSAGTVLGGYCIDIDY